MIGTGICFDCGSSNMRLAVEGKGIVVSEPSVVAIDEETGKISAIGNKAYEMIGKTPDLISISKPVKEGSIYDFQSIQNALSYYVQRFCANKVLKPHILVSVPANASTVDRRSVLDLATNAGAAKACVVEEPLAAAVGAGLDMNRYRGTMIVDIGGGTTDISIISRGLNCVTGSSKTAGDSFDECIINYLKKERNLIVGKRMAEKIKTSIACAEKPEVELAVRAAGKDSVTNLPSSVEVTSSEIFSCLKECYDMIVEEIRKVLEVSPPELTSDVASTGITLTGGCAGIRGIDKYIQNKTGVPTKIAPSPELCVVKGMLKILKNPTLLERNGYYFKSREELDGYEE